jgi:hypothetical protein
MQPQPKDNEFHSTHTSARLAGEAQTDKVIMESPDQDQRRVRFASVDGIAREDLPLAYEVWLDEFIRAPWMTREAMKLGPISFSTWFGLTLRRLPFGASKAKSNLLQKR